MRIPSLRILALAGSVLALASCQSPPGITGRVVPRGRVDLPPRAVLEVQVSDVSRTDAAPVVLARRDYSPLGAAPWSFTLESDRVRALDPTHVYAVQARVLVDGLPRLVSKRRTVVDPTRLADTLDVVVESVARTVGERLGPGAAPRPGLWNPPGAPATFAAPVFPPVARAAAEPEPAPAIAASLPTPRVECPSRPVP